MGPLLHFPSAESMVSFLAEHPLLKTDYCEEKGVTKAIAELAAKRFADREKSEIGVRIGVLLMIRDLQEEKSGVAGKELPNLGKLRLTPEMWA